MLVFVIIVCFLLLLFDGWVEQEGALNLGTIIVVGVGVGVVAVCYCCLLLLLFDGWVEQEGV